MFLLGFCLDRGFFFSMHNIDSRSLELGTVSQFRGGPTFTTARAKTFFMFKNSMRIISGTKNHEAQEATLVDRGSRGFSLNCFTFMA